MTTTTELPPIPERVAAGAAWLDENEPDWLAKIDLDTLDLESGYNCPLGQLYDNFDKAPPVAAAWREYYSYPPSSIGVYADTRRTIREFAVPLGFMFGDDEDEYPALTAAWRELITARRGA